MLDISYNEWNIVESNGKHSLIASNQTINKAMLKKYSN